MSRPMFFKLSVSDVVVATEGLRGVVPMESSETFDQIPFISFVYDGGTTMQIGFNSDEQMRSYLIVVRKILEVKDFDVHYSGDTNYVDKPIEVS